MPSSSHPHTGTFEQNCCHSVLPPPGVSKEAEMHDELEYVRLMRRYSTRFKNKFKNLKICQHDIDFTTFSIIF